MQKNKNLQSISIFQYQHHFLQQRYKQIHNINTTNNNTNNTNINKNSQQQISFLSQLDSSDIGFIYDTLKQGKNIILKHSTPIPINYQNLINLFKNIQVKNIKIINGIQKIHVYLFEKMEEKKQEILFVSLFNIQYLIYKPYLIKLLKNIKQSNGKIKCILYCQNIQQLQITQIISIYYNNNNNNNNTNTNDSILNQFEEIELDVPAPFEYVISDNLLQVLQNFLRDQQKQVIKKDVIIFHAPTEQFKKKLFYLTKTKGFSLSTSIMYQSPKSLSSLQNQKQQQQSIQTKQLSYIYVAQNTKQLLKQNYNLLQVYLVLDFQQDKYTYFNYQRLCYYQINDKFSYTEMCRRVNFNYGNIGQYVCSNKYNSSSNNNIGNNNNNNCNNEYITRQEQKKYYDYGLYCIIMVDIGLIQQLKQQAKQNTNIHYCLSALKNAQIINKNNQISSRSIIQLVRQGINPILASSILSSLSSQQSSQQEQQNIKKTHLLILTHAIFTCSNLRNIQYENQPSSIWHKTGYLESCLDIIIRCLQFNIQDSMLTFQEIGTNFQMNLQSYQEIVKQYKKIKKLVKCVDFKWSNQMQEDQFNLLLEELITVFKPAVGTFSGSRRLGYLFKGFNKGLLAHRKCLMSYFNEKPNFILVTKVIIDSKNQQPLILNCNYVRDDILILTYGCLPTLSKQSFGQCEIQFHNISTAVFSHLSKFNGLQMDIFQNQNFCSIEANSQLNIITIQCSKQKQKDINQKFAKVLKDIEQMFKKQTKSFKQSHLLKVVLSSGGQIQQFIVIQKQKANQIMEMAVLKNLAPEVGIQQLKELFDQFVQLKDIKMIEDSGKNQALIYFYSTDDYRKFFQFFSGCNYYDYCMIVQPYVQTPRSIQKEHYMLFQWNVWKSTGQALIQFETIQHAKSSLVNFKCLAGEKAKIQQKANMIYAQRLDPKVDQKDLQSWVSGQGTVVNIQVRRFAPNNKIYEDISIKNIIRNSNPKQSINCQVGKIIKDKNGHRSCQVRGLNKNQMNELFFILNEVQGLAGNGKLYVSPIFTYPINLPQPDEIYVRVYQDIVNDFSKQLGRFIPLTTQIIKEPLKWTMVIKTNSEQQMEIISKTFSTRLVGVPLNINCKDTSLLFTQLAIKNFERLEKKLPVKIIPDFLQKKIKVLCKPSTLAFIQKQINTQIMQSFIYPIILYQKAFTFIQKNISQIVAEQIKNGLKYKFETITRTLKLQGNLYILQKTRQKINKSLIKLKQNIQENNTTTENMCGLCCEDYKNPFKLQGCGHTFCFDCIQDSIHATVQDITMYPIKCPQCRQKIWVSDLNCLIDKKTWGQILKISVNHFIFTHPGEFMFCFTAGCTFICNIKYKSNYSCPQCKKGYCLSCRNLFHPGMTCHEARYGSDRLFTEYMSTVGGRVCANKQCKAPIQRISGCFKVQCSRCKKCMCFKCPANSMTPYDTPQQTYNHMNRAHGGCF